MELRLLGNAFICDIKVNGTPLEALVDTGASYTFVLEQVLRKLDLAVVGGRKIGCIHGESRKLPMYECLVRMEDAETSEDVVGLPQSFEVGGRELKALLGRASLVDYVIRLDWPKREGEMVKSAGASGSEKEPGSSISVGK